MWSVRLNKCDEALCGGLLKGHSVSEEGSVDFKSSGIRASSDEMNAFAFRREFAHGSAEELVVTVVELFSERGVEHVGEGHLLPLLERGLARERRSERWR